MANCERKLNLHYLAWRTKYRSHFEIMASMLEAVKDNGATRFSIMKHTGTNFVKIKEYLESLTEMGFVETDIKEDRVLYRASEKGREYLRQYYTLLEILFSTSPYENIVLPKLTKVLAKVGES